MKNFVVVSLRLISRAGKGGIFRLRELFRLFVHPEYYMANSYFPEIGRRKSSLRILFEQLYHILYYGDIERFYFLYGFDIKGFRKPQAYVDDRKFMRVRNELNKENFTKPICVLRNKFLFGIVAEALGIRTPENLGIILNYKVYSIKEKREISLNAYLNNNLDVFIKDVSGECGTGIFSLKSEAGKVILNGEVIEVEMLFSLLKPDVQYIVQKRIIQHESIDRLYNQAINTIRLCTVHDPFTHQICILPPLLRIGTLGNKVDNWAKGGLAVGIDKQCTCLKEYGFYKPGYGTKTNRHPDSGVIFKDYQIPYLSEALEMATFFHRHLNGIHSIGWDIAITPEGPCFVEGNDNWEVSLMQICSGWSKEFCNLFLNKNRS